MKCYFVFFSFPPFHFVKYCQLQLSMGYNLLALNLLEDSMETENLKSYPIVASYADSAWL